MRKKNLKLFRYPSIQFCLCKITQDERHIIEINVKEQLLKLEAPPVSVGRKAFTLIEVLIALAISSFIMVSMFRIYLNVISSIDKSSEIMTLNRKVCLLFDQLEKDLSACYIPKLHEEEKSEKKQANKNEKEKKGGQEERKRSQEDKKKKKEVKFFTGEVYEGEGRRIEGKRWELFKNINFITTNPLEIYGQKKVRLVRVMYELVKDKRKSTREKTSYLLLRKETKDLENVKFKDPEEFIKKEKKQEIRKNIVADNIKEVFVEYLTIKDKKDKEQPSFFDRGKAVDTQSVGALVGVLKKKKPKKIRRKKLGSGFLHSFL